MAQEDDAEERAEMADPEHLRHETARQRDGAQPSQAHGGREEHDDGFGLRCHGESTDHDTADQVESSENLLLTEAAAELAAAPASGHVEEADQGERRRAQARRHVAEGEVARQVRRDEGELEAAGEEAEREKLIAGVSAGLQTFVQCQRNARL